MKSRRPGGETFRLKSQISALEQLMEVYERSVLEQADKLLADIEQRRKDMEALRLRQRAIESSSNGMVITDATLPHNPIIYVNPAFESITGYSASEVMGKNPRFLLGDDRRQIGSEKVRSAIRAKAEVRAVLRNYRKDGSLFWNDLMVAPVRDEAGNVTHYIGVQNDITELKRYEQEVERQANYDTLTGLANRNLFRDRLDHAIAFSKRSGRPVAVAFLDIDNFKVINDSFGHGAGDQLLKVIAGRLISCIRATDTAARFGGDEFVLLFPEQLSVDNICGIVERVRETLFLTFLADELKRVLATVAEPIIVDSNEVGITCSIGVSVYPQDGEEAETLLKNADTAMYRAKEQGRNTFQFYTSKMNEEMVARMTTEKHLRRALKAGELHVHYQPQASLEEGRVVGVEALLRWRNPELGSVPPSTFVPLAEETGLILPVGEWVLKTACFQGRRWLDNGVQIDTIAVNISARQFWHPGFFDMVTGALEESGLDPHVLELELVERMVVRDVDSAAAMLNKLKSLGVRLSMDDFGTGYSSLSYLQHLPFDKLKIDISFVRGMTTDPGKASIVKAIIAMGHNLGLKVLAEGVETAEQLHYLRQQECDEIQGFYFGRPMPAGKLEALLKNCRHALQPSSPRHARRASLSRR